MKAHRCKAIPLCVLFVLTGPGLMHALLAADAIVVQTTCPADGLPPPAQEFASPSGTYRLAIQAETLETLYGGTKVAAFGSKSRCRLMRGTTVLWDKKLPFVMNNVIVTDQGQSVGVAFKVDESEWRSTLFLVIVDAAGDTVLCEKHPQAPNRGIVSSFPPAPLLPNPMQIAISPELDRAVFWLHENSTECGKKFGETVFRVHELSTGNRKAIVYPDNINPQPKARRSLEDVRPVSMPELLMLRYVHYTWPIEPEKFENQGESLELVDVRGLVVWQTYIDNPAVARDPSNRPMLGRKPQYLNCSQVVSTKSGFVIEDGFSGKKSEYRISKDKSGWVVSEPKLATSNRASP